MGLERDSSDSIGCSARAPSSLGNSFRIVTGNGMLGTGTNEVVRTDGRSCGARRSYGRIGASVSAPWSGRKLNACFFDYRGSRKDYLLSFFSFLSFFEGLPPSRTCPRTLVEAPGKSWASVAGSPVNS